MSENEKAQENVRSFADFRKKKDEDVPAEAKPEGSLDSESYFSDMKKANDEKKRLMEKERAAANKGVIRSHRLK